jgi:hypothetical protein
MLAGRAATKVLARYDDIAFIYFTGKIRRDILHAVLAQFILVSANQIFCRNDIVGINIIAKFMDSSFDNHWRISQTALILSWDESPSAVPAGCARDLRDGQFFL